MFEIVYDGRRTDGRRLDGYTISSPCEPNGSGELTRTVRGSDYSPAIELSEQKEKLVTATGDIEKYSEKQANKVWLNSVDWFSRY